MATDELERKLDKHLTDVHSIEEQALVQMRRAPDLAGDDALARDFAQHLRETEEQEAAVRGRLEARGAEPSSLKDAAGKAGGLGMVFFARSQPDTPIKLLAHAYSYENLEAAAYELLRASAERAGDEETAQLARRIGEQERQMADRLEQRYEEAVEAQLGDADGEQLGEQLDAYLSDLHAIEAQAAQLLESGPKLVDDERLAELFEQHREETKEHARRLEERLDARGASASLLKDAALRVGGLNVGAFFAAQPDTDAKLAGFAFAFEHLECGGYEMLGRVARRAADEETAVAAEANLRSEREMATRLGSYLAAALDPPATME